jgi:putative mycofactocin binding protein MftB
VRRLLTPTALSDHDVLDRALGLHPSVALRPEPFGALAYHYDNRRLVFLKHPSMVDLVRTLDEHPDLRSALEAHDIAPELWDTYDRAVTSLIESEVVIAR